MKLGIALIIMSFLAIPDFIVDLSHPLVEVIIKADSL